MIDTTTMANVATMAQLAAVVLIAGITAKRHTPVAIPAIMMMMMMTVALLKTMPTIADQALKRVPLEHFETVDIQNSNLLCRILHRFQTSRLTAGSPGCQIKLGPSLAHLPCRLCFG